MTWDFPFVDEDGVDGMQQVTEHLIALGHRRIACISSPPDLMFSQHRLSGFQAGLAAHGLSFEDAFIVEGDLTQRDGFRQAERLLDLPEPANRDHRLQRSDGARCNERCAAARSCGRWRHRHHRF